MGAGMRLGGDEASVGVEVVVGKASSGGRVRGLFRAISREFGMCLIWVRSAVYGV